MKNLLKVLVVSLVLVASSSFANSDNYNYSFNIHSLVGIEGGYDGKVNIPTSTSTSTSKNTGHFGIMIGAQTQNYRIFLNARKYNISGFEYVNSVGAQAQYLFVHLKVADIFMGMGAGVMYMQTNTSGSNFKFNKAYYSGGFGVNFHLSNNFDLDIGARYMYLGYQGQNSQVSVSIDHITSVYSSLIYRFQMN